MLINPHRPPVKAMIEMVRKWQEIQTVEDVFDRLRKPMQPLLRRSRRVANSLNSLSNLPTTQLRGQAKLRSKPRLKKNQRETIPRSLSRHLTLALGATTGQDACIFHMDKGSMKISLENFEDILTGRQFGLTPVKFTYGEVEWVRSTPKKFNKPTLRSKTSE